MKTLKTDDLISIEEYDRQRQSFRASIIALKQRRRISVGPLITLLFENRDTLMFQVQEMIRAEHIVDSVKVQEELDVYNALLPDPDELSATLLIEITEEATMQDKLDQFMGLDHGNKLSIIADGEAVFGEFEGGRSHESKISAVHFVRFRPTASMQRTFSDLTRPVKIRVDHGGYQHEVSVLGTMREEWLADLKSTAES